MDGVISCIGNISESIHEYNTFPSALAVRCADSYILCFFYMTYTYSLPAVHLEVTPYYRGVSGYIALYS